jgi:hypothetical protein
MLQRRRLATAGGSIRWVERVRPGAIKNTASIERWMLDVERWTFCLALRVVTARIDRFIAEGGKGPYRYGVGCSRQR